MKVVMLMAITADGKIAKHADHFPDWTGTVDKRLFARLSRKAGVVIMGSRTYDTIGAPLPGRLNVVMTRNARRISDQGDLWYTGLPPEKIVASLEERGYQEAVLAGGATVNTLFAHAGLIGEVVLTVSSRFFGDGMSLFTAAVDLPLELNTVERIDTQLVMLCYRVTTNKL
ncbi:MAG: dihydrofolate reductase family protein [Pseudomonadota bacterium]